MMSLSDLTSLSNNQQNIPDHSRHELRFASYEFRYTSCKFKDTSYEFKFKACPLFGTSAIGRFHCSNLNLSFSGAQQNVLG